ncbi:hypothetical protein D3C81_772580 [compost metagenome]
MDGNWKADVERSLISSAMEMFGGDVRIEGASHYSKPKPKAPEKRPIAIIAVCLNCKKRWNISNKDVGKEIRCKDCGGYIITPSGKVFSKVYWTGEEKAVRRFDKI